MYTITIIYYVFIRAVKCKNIARRNRKQPIGLLVQIIRYTYTTNERRHVM